jgi:hypothetical protein
VIPLIPVSDVVPVVCDAQTRDGERASPSTEGPERRQTGKWAWATREVPPNARNDAPAREMTPNAIPPDTRIVPLARKVIPLTPVESLTLEKTESVDRSRTGLGHIPSRFRLPSAYSAVLSIRD